MDRVYTVNGRFASTPGALGERKIIETLPKDEQGNIKRFSRPDVMLRRRLTENAIGGRADTIESKKEYGVLYEEDINSAYPYCSQKTVDPSETPKRFGSIHRILDRSKLDGLFSYYAYIDFVLPLNSYPPKFGPLAVRDDRGRLTYPTDNGKLYSGWYWKEEIESAIELGYEVSIYHGYGWCRSSNWLEEWANNMFALKNSLSSEPEVQSIIKREMVAAIGRFGMAPETLSLVTEYQKGDLPITISNPDRYGDKTSKYFIRVTPNPDSNKLTHINSYIVMRCRQELLSRMLQEESEGDNVVVASNYDAYYVLRESKLSTRRGGLGGWKSHSIKSATIHGSRSITGIRDGKKIDKRPGVPLKGRTPKDST